MHRIVAPMRIVWSPRVFAAMTTTFFVTFATLLVGFCAWQFGAAVTFRESHALLIPWRNGLALPARVYVINMKSAEQRRAWMKEQEVWQRGGIPFEFVDAVTVKSMQEDDVHAALRQRVFQGVFINTDKNAPRDGHSATEMATTLSHVSIWKKVRMDGSSFLSGY